jgi:hypothetical protein
MQEGAKEAAASVRGEIDVALRRVAGPSRRSANRRLERGGVVHHVYCGSDRPMGCRPLKGLGSIALIPGQRARDQFAQGWRGHPRHRREVCCQSRLLAPALMSVPIADLAPAARASGRSFHCLTIRVQVTVLSASAGSLSLPSITRKTDKGLPLYFDGEDSDVFILSGAEDLVPIYRQDPDGSAGYANHAEYQRDVDGFWVRDKATGRSLVHEDRIDGLSRAPLPTARRRACSRASSAGAKSANRKMCIGARSRKDNIAYPLRATPKNRESSIQLDKTAHLQLADQRDARRQGQCGRL